MPEIYKCSKCNREVWWQGEDTFTDLVGKQYSEGNIPIICCECDGNMRNNWFPKNSNKDRIVVSISEQNVCCKCHSETGYGSAGGRLVLGDKKDAGKSYHFKREVGLCERCRESSSHERYIEFGWDHGNGLSFLDY